MKYTVTKQRIEYIGQTWMPSITAAMVADLSPYDMANLGDPTDRDDVEHWLMLHSGDFQNVTDFRADFDVDGKHIVHEWMHEESEFMFADCMFPSEDDA